MIGFSQTLGYAVQILACLDCKRPRQTDDLVLQLTVPRAYLRKIVNHLALEGLVMTQRGRKGGVMLSRPAESISLLQLVKAIEGSNWISPCLLSMDTCNALRYCPLKDFWSDIRKTLESRLRTTSLKEVISTRSGLGTSASEVDTA